jgi:hypothetical protein
MAPSLYALLRVRRRRSASGPCGVVVTAEAGSAGRDGRYSRGEDLQMPGPSIVPEGMDQAASRRESLVIADPPGAALPSLVTAQSRVERPAAGALGQAEAAGACRGPSQHNSHPPPAQGEVRHVDATRGVDDHARLKVHALAVGLRGDVQRPAPGPPAIRRSHQEDGGVSAAPPISGIRHVDGATS